MKKIIYSAAFLCLFTGLSQAENAWKQIADFPGDGRAAVSTFSYIDYGYVGCGYDGLNFRRSFYAYQPVTDTWISTMSMGNLEGSGLERNVAASFTIGNVGYVGCGQGGSAFLKDFWAYNYTTNHWTYKSDFGGTDTRSAVGFSIGDKGYIALGQDVDGFKKDCWQYDTTSNTWTQKADFTGTARRLASVFVLLGKAYVGLGDDGSFTKDFYMYDPVANAWFLRSDFGGTARYGATAFAVNGKGYVACGYDNTLHNVSDFWEYNPSLDSWSMLTDFPGGARANVASFVIDTMAYVGMGYDSTYRYDVYMWGDTTTRLPEDTTDTNIAIINIERPLMNIEIFPEPVSSNATIEIAANSYNENAEIKIYDLHGNDVTSGCIVLKIGTNGTVTTYSLQTDKLPPGTYALAVYGSTMNGAKKFIVL